MSVFDKQDKAVILLGNDYLRDATYMIILDNQGKNAIDLVSSNIENGVSVYDKKSGKTGVSLYADERESGITVMDKAGNIKWKAPQ